MQGTASHAPVISYISASFPANDFTVIDVGCAGGIDQIWRSVGSRLRAVAIDGDVNDVARLQRDETHPGIHYLAALAGLAEDHPLSRKRKEEDRGYWARNPWKRLSTPKSVELQNALRHQTPPDTHTMHWSEVPQAPEVVEVPGYVRAQGITSVDFLKIDVDGADFDILTSFDTELDSLNVLGVGIEVNFFGSASDTDNTLHNVDRFLKARGFELFGLTVRPYSMAALPSRSVLSIPSGTEFGRPLQGDALYVRDLASPEYQAIAARMPEAKLANLISLFAAFGLPDCAADVALRFSDRLRPFCNVDGMLDLLAAQAQKYATQPLSYPEYMQRFAASDRMFFTDPPEVATPENRDWQGELRQAEENVARLEVELREQQDVVSARELTLSRLELELKAQHDAATAHAFELDSTRHRLAEATNRITAMETSKFWKLRRAWFQIKRAMGSGDNE